MMLSGKFSGVGKHNSFGVCKLQYKLAKTIKRSYVKVTNTATPPTDVQPKSVSVQEEYTLKVQASPFTINGDVGDVASATLPLITRFPAGIAVLGWSPSIEQDDQQYALVKLAGNKLKESSKISSLKRPIIPLQLYEFEACPFCKKVREAVSMLDLDVEFYPCPKGGERFRSVVMEKGGKSMFPFLIDPNTEQQMYESDDIIQYLFQEYGDGQVPLYMNLPQNLSTTLAGLGLSLRREKGRNAQPSKASQKPLVLYGYEPSPFVKLVREKLCELEIPYLYKNAARGSIKRQELFDKWGKFAVPYIEDPNTKIAMFESGEILKYLEDTYAA